MTVIDMESRRAPGDSATNSHRKSPGRFQAWLVTHRTSLLVLVPLLIIVGLGEGIGFNAYPHQYSDDPGTYASQANAIIEWGRLSETTYWYDHPPGGWIQIALYAAITGGFGRVPTAVNIVNEVMLIAHLVSSALIFAFARRLKFGRFSAALAVLLFTFSPLAMFYHRTGYLDNLEIAWLFGAMVFAVSPRRSLSAALGCAACLAMALLTKETALLLTPMVVWLLLRNYPKGGRTWPLGLSGTLFTMMVLSYPLFAILKGELFPGEGHVSLFGGIMWQLFERAGTGSVVDPDSVSRMVFDSWMNIDPWLMLLGAAAMLPALFMRRLWPLAFGLAFQLAMMLRSGYLPLPYLVALLPFCALLIAGVVDATWKARLPLVSRSARARHSKLREGVARSGIGLVAAAAIAFGVFVAPGWVSSQVTMVTKNEAVHSIEAVNWVKRNVPSNAMVVADANIQLDLRRAGRDSAVWWTKVDLDPAINKQFKLNGKNGWRNIEWIVMREHPQGQFAQFPTLIRALENAKMVESFGSGESAVYVWRVA